MVLYAVAKQMARHKEGVMVIDDSTLDKPYAHQMELVTRHGSGKHHLVVQGINLITALWTDGTAIVPVDYCIYSLKRDRKSKNDHFRDILEKAKKRGFQPECVFFDSWYANIENLKLVRSITWHWFTWLKSDRLVDPDHMFNRPVSDVTCPPEGRMVHLSKYGFIRVFQVERGDGETKYWATDILDASESERSKY